MISSIWTFTRRSLRGTLPLLLLMLLVALPAAVALQSGQSPALAARLFESPASPVEEPTATQAPAPAKPVATAAKPKPEKVLPPTVAAPAAQPEQPKQEEPTAPPTQPPAEQKRVPAPPTQAPAAEAPTSPPPPPPAAEQAPPPPPPPAPGQEMPPGSGEVIIDSGLLIDSILVYVSYAWLCCGILLFILIPIVFVGLYIWGAQRRKNADGFE